MKPFNSLDGCKWCPLNRIRTESLNQRRKFFKKKSTFKVMVKSNIKFE